MRVRGLITAIAVVLALALPAAASAASYVALGDSYVAGPLIPLQLPPYGCLKSDHNYAHLAAPELGLELRDPSCSGAETEDMTQAQGVSPGRHQRLVHNQGAARLQPDRDCCEPAGLGHTPAIERQKRETQHGDDYPD